MRVDDKEPYKEPELVIVPLITVKFESWFRVESKFKIFLLGFKILVDILYFWNTET